MLHAIGARLGGETAQLMDEILANPTRRRVAAIAPR